jgi:hypothetical protein
MRSLLPSLFLLLIALPAGARPLFHYDLQSLAYMSSAIIQGNVTAAKEVNGIDALTIKITKSHLGDFKQGDSIVVGTSAYAKTADVHNLAKLSTGDHLILFIQPTTPDSVKQAGLDHWVISSGVKLIFVDKVTGMRQDMNPGPYINSIDEGPAAEYPDKLAAAIHFAADFRKSFARNKSNAPWLLDQLQSRPPISKDDFNRRDQLAADLCQALAATHDAKAIAKANELRTDSYERQLLDGK